MKHWTDRYSNRDRQKYAYKYPGMSATASKLKLI